MFAFLFYFIFYFLKTICSSIILRGGGSANGRKRGGKGWGWWSIQGLKMQRKQGDWKQRVWIREVHEPMLLGGTTEKFD
jgi:hypothetical protein